MKFGKALREDDVDHWDCDYCRTRILLRYLPKYDDDEEDGANISCAYCGEDVKN